MCFLKTVPSAICVLWDRYIVVSVQVLKYMKWKIYVKRRVSL